MAKKHITITGDLGVGKSSVAKKLCEMLSFRYLSTGQIQRELAKSKGMNTLELNYYAENNSEVDKYIDDHLIKINDSEDAYVIDSRMAWFFVKNSLKIYISAHPHIAAGRVLADMERKGEPAASDLISKSKELLERRSVEDRRFKKIYGVDCADPGNFDIVIDSSRASINEITLLIVRLFELSNKELPVNKYWVSPYSLLPTKEIDSLETGNDKMLKDDDVPGNDFDMNFPPEVIKYDNLYYIINGHKKVCEAINQNIALIPVKLIGYDAIHAGPEAVHLIQHWEEKLKFLFDVYPDK